MVACVEPENNEATMVACEKPETNGAMMVVCEEPKTNGVKMVKYQEQQWMGSWSNWSINGWGQEAGAPVDTWRPEQFWTVKYQWLYTWRSTGGSDPGGVAGSVMRGPDSWCKEQILVI